MSHSDGKDKATLTMAYAQTQFSGVFKKIPNSS